ncbi:Bro-N domain-containing protein [Alicyclobacillus sendaiensis]|uniref:Bro-N domain-containing protein n=1 Tax=Alicyclobacillus sendaiensis TaxID=192387 RepID=UPI0026F43A31|nr:Bro-N domain-containing protein [Alicyclobacillus sendaiensis]
MTDIVEFVYEGHQVRTVLIDGEPWWVAKDVCNALGHTNSRVALERLDDDEKGVSTVYTPGGPQQMAIINEAGLYRLIFTSRVDEAERFKRWVSHEVLPSIRRTGMYAVPQSPMAIEDLIILQAQSVKELKAKVAELEEKTRVAMARIDIFDNVNIIGDPKQRLNAMIRKYAARNGLTYQQGWRDFRTAFNTAYRTNIVLLMEHHKAKHGLKSLTMPEYLEQTGRLDDALRVADKMLNPRVSEKAEAVQ